MRHWINLCETLTRNALSDLCRAVKNDLGVTLDTDLIDPETIYVAWVQRDNGTAGAGFAAMQRLLAFADERHLGVTLTVLRDSPKLVRFYQRLGFTLDYMSDEEFLAHEAEWDINTAPDGEITMTRRAG